MELLAKGGEVHLLVDGKDPVGAVAKCAKCGAQIPQRDWDVAVMVAGWFGSKEPPEFTECHECEHDDDFSPNKYSENEERERANFYAAGLKPPDTHNRYDVKAEHVQELKDRGSKTRDKTHFITGRSDQDGGQE